MSIEVESINGVPVNEIVDDVYDKFIFGGECDLCSKRDMRDIRIFAGHVYDVSVSKYMHRNSGSSIHYCPVCGRNIPIKSYKSNL